MDEQWLINDVVLCWSNGPYPIIRYLIYEVHLYPMEVIRYHSCLWENSGGSKKIHIHDATKLVLIIVRIFMDNIAYKTVHKQRWKIFHMLSGLVVRSYSFSRMTYLFEWASEMFLNTHTQSSTYRQIKHLIAHRFGLNPTMNATKWFPPPPAT